MDTAKVPQPAERFLRLAQVLTIVPVGKSTWWAGVKSGRFPKPIKIGARTTCWRLSDIDALVREYSEEQRRAA